MARSVYLAFSTGEFRPIDTLRDDGSTRLVRVEERDAPFRRHLVKYRAGDPSRIKAVRLHTDHAVVSGYALSCALPFERLAGSGQETVLHFRDPGGTTLDTAGSLTVEQCLDIAADGVAALNEVHRAGLMHRDLCPASFLLSPERLYITDFSRALRLQREYRDLQALERNLDRMIYMAPELTGRLNRAVDFRADYYSFGVILYRLLTGHLPFRADDPHELMYQHLAFEPASPRDLNEDIPETLARIVLRLLEKDPDGRYQQGRELLSHLCFARDIVRGVKRDDVKRIVTTSSVRPFLDGPPQLHGRHEERRTLLAALERAFDHRPQLLLISGASGIGKTTLIRETYLPVTRQRAFFISGKFDQLQRRSPYSAWLDALETLVEFVVAEPEESLATWRARLADALGARAGVLSELVPSLQVLLGDQPAPEALPPAEAKERLNEVFLEFFNVFSKTERPLVLFLDDLQWIDRASLDLLETLARRLDDVPILFIGAYRGNEVSATHPLRLALNGLHEHGRFTRSELALCPLEHSDVARLLVDGTQRTAGEVEDLALEIMRRTRGNPFFMWQLLRTIRENGWLFTDADGQRWNWNLEAIKRAEFADEVVDLMLHRFHALPERTRELLSWGACLGAGFDLDTLSWLAGSDMQTVHRELQPALREEFVLPLSDPELIGDCVLTRAFRFFHDRMQEAAYRAIPVAALPALHHRIANLLRERLPAAEQSARVIEIAGHLNLGRELIATVEDGLDLARVNLQAARRAKSATAFSEALEHLRLGMSRLTVSLWESEPDLAYELYRERAELEYLNSDFEAAEWFAAQAIGKETDVVRRADLYHMLIVQFTLRARYAKAVETARHGLALFGEYLPEDGFEEARDTELAVVGNLLRGRPLSVLADLPPMRDARQRAVMNLFTGLGPPCYRAHPRLWSVLVARQVRLCLEQGVIPGVTYSYPAFGGLLTHVGTGGGEECATLYEVTRRLMDEFDDSAAGSVGYLMMGSSLRHWFAPMRTASQDYLDAYKSGQESGNLQYAVYGFGHNTYCRYFSGDPLDDLIPDAVTYLEYSQQRRNLWGIDLITGALRVFQLLYGEWSSADWPNKGEPEEAYLARCEEHGNLQALCIYHIMRASALLQLGDLQNAAWSAREAESRLDSVSVQGLLPITQFYALKTLVLAEAPELMGAGPEDVERFMTDAMDRYGRWRRGCPNNFNHWYEMLVAERARRSGDLDRLIESYDAALHSAQQQSYWPAVTLIARRAECFWRERGNHSFADVYGQQAQHALEFTRASAVLARIDDGSTEEPAHELRGAQMDAIIQIAQALSLHTELENLVPEIIRNVAQQIGAQRVVLVLAEEQELRLAMESGVRLTRYYDDPPPLDSVSAVPRSVIRYVARTQRRQRFVDADIDNSLLLRTDPYIRELRAREAGFRGAAWCVPLSYLGQSLGVLYLEHGSTANAFDEKQEPLIEFLAAQAAISVRSVGLMKRLTEEGRARRNAEHRMQTADAEIAIRREQEERLKRLANTDVLTDLANRRMFVESLKTRWDGREGAPNPSVSVIMLDIDHFKRVNDQHGHAVGDAVLRHFAGLFHHALRPSDLAARIGGEEFAVLLLDTGQNQVMDIARRLCRMVADTPAPLEGEAIAFTVSVGVATAEASDRSYECLLSRADQALYRAKSKGRNCVSC